MAIGLDGVSKLGFGCMRFTGREDDKIDIAYTADMIDRYLAAGGNYFDTAWAYPNSEAALREALVKRHPRDSFFIADKCVAWTHCNSADDLEKQLEESLENLGVDCIDLYLMHNLGGNRTAAFEKYDAWEFVKSVKARGLARHIGFSAHCTPEEPRRPHRSLPRDGVRAAAGELPGLGEPVVPRARMRRGGAPPRKAGGRHGTRQGGILADPPQAVKDILDTGMPDDSYATAALRFSASVDGVITTLSGMSTVEQVEDNCRAFADFKPLSDVGLAVIGHAQRAMEASGTIPCTGCDYCAKVCPVGVGISGSMTALNYYINFGDAEAANYQLGFIVRFNGGKKMPNECIRCGACEQACPQNIKIMECFDRIDREITPFRKPQMLMKP